MPAHFIRHAEALGGGAIPRRRLQSPRLPCRSSQATHPNASAPRRHGAPAPAAAAAILGTGASVYSIGLEPLGGTVESSGYRLSLAPVERGSGSVSAIFKSVSSYFSSSSSSTTSNAKLATLTLASDWMVTLSTAQQAPNQPEEKMLDCYKRTGAGQPYTHTGTYPLGPLVKEYLDTTGMGNQGSHVADIALMPPGEAAIGQGKLFILLALQAHAADANCELVLIDATISSTGSVRLASPLPPKPSTSIASLPPPTRRPSASPPPSALSAPLSPCARRPAATAQSAAVRRGPFVTLLESRRLNS